MKWIVGGLLGLFLFARANAAENLSPDLIAEPSNNSSPQQTSLNLHEGADVVMEIEAALHGFPEMFDLQGKKLADGEFTQWLQNDLLHVTLSYDLGSAHRIVEKTTFRQKPRLVQEDWSWRESQSGKLLRHFELDFKSATVLAEKCTENKTNKWVESLKMEPGRTFAGFGFVLALKSVRDRLVAGEKVELKAVGFMPKPRVVSVELSYGGLERMAMAGRTITGDRFVIHPKVPAIAKAFVEVKDIHIWLTTPRPVGFLRSEGPLIEADDSVARIDLLPGVHSGPAEPVRALKSK
jgi:hypothetical protein